MNQIKAVVLDWAGTTVDFGCFAPLDVFKRIFADKGIELTLEEVRLPMGMAKKDHIRAILLFPRITALWQERFGIAWTETDVEAMYADFEPLMMETLAGHTEVLEGVIDTCGWLRRNRIKIGSTTGYTGKMMETVCREAGKKGYMPDAVVTADMVGGCGRPAPDMMFKNMELLGVYPPSAIVKVGDTVADIEEGLNAGAVSVGVVVGSSVMGMTKEEYGALDEKEKIEACRRAAAVFCTAGADHVILSLKELPALIEMINSKRRKA